MVYIVLEGFIGDLGSKWAIAIIITTVATIATLILHLRYGVALLDIPVFPHKIFPSFFFPSRILFDNIDKGKLIKFKENKWYSEQHEGYFIMQSEVFKRIPDSETMEILGFLQSSAETIEPTYFTKYNIFDIPTIKEADIFFYREAQEKMEYFVEIGGKLRPIADLYSYNRFKEINAKFSKRNFHIIGVGKKNWYPIVVDKKISPAISSYDSRLTIQYLEQQFDLSLSTWLTKRYENKNKHIPGQIKKILDEQFFELNARLNLNNEMEQNKVIYYECFASAMLILKEDLPSRIISPLENIRDFLNREYRDLFDILWRALNEIDWNLYDKDLTDKLTSLVSGLKKVRIETEEQKQPFFANLKKLLNKLDQLLQFDVNNFFARIYPTHTMLVGNAYIGKTHGLADYTNTRLKNNEPGIIIQALTVNSDNWIVILNSNIHFLGNLLEIEAIKVLQDFASSFDLKREIFIERIGIVQTSTKVLICCDGIDEAHDKTTWVNRINSLQNLCVADNVRFVFTTRPSFIDFYFKTPPECIRVVRLVGKSDAPFDELKSTLFSEYEITVEFSNWLDYYIDTPLSLKLFCEQHRGARIIEQTDVQINLSGLLQRKMSNLNKELSQKMKIAEENLFIERVLKVLGKKFATDSSLSEIAIHDAIKTDAITQTYYDNNLVNQTIRELCNSEVLVPVDMDGDIPKAYSINERSILEYLLADYLHETKEYSHYPKVLDELQGALEIFSQILYLREKTFVGENGVWEDIDSSKAMALKLKVLSKTSPRDITNNDVEFVKNILLSKK